MSDAPSKPNMKTNASSPGGMGTEATADTAEVAGERLRQLCEALRPIMAHLPTRPDGINVTIDEAGNLRLHLDRSWFVDITPDGRAYRLRSLGRDGSTVLAKSGSLEGAIDSATAAMVRRVVEGEQRLKPGTIPFHSAVALVEGPASGGLDRNVGARQKAFSAGLLYGLGQAFWFVVEVVGLLVLFGLGWMGLQAWMAELSP